MALIKGKLIDPSTAIKQSSDPVSNEDLARKGYVDSIASSEADAAEQAAKSYADQKISDLVNGAPAMLDTLKELADALEAGDAQLSQEILTQIGNVDDKIDQEISDRQSAVSSEASARQLADQNLQSEIDAEELARQSGDTALGVRIDGVESDLAQEVLDRQSAISSEQSARESADNALDGRLDVLEGSNTVVGSVAKAEKDAKDYADSKFSQEQTRAQGEESRIEGKVDQEILDRQSAVSAEQTARESADMALDARLDVLEADPTTKTYVDGKFSDAEAYTDQKVSDLVNGAPAMLDTLKELADAITSQGGSLTDQILTQVGEVDDKIDQEISDRQAADLVLDGKITTEKNRAEGEEARIEGKVDQEVLDRQSADQSLQSEIDAVESSVAQEILDRQSAVSGEASARQTADSNLQSQIDDLVSDLAAEQTARENADQDLDNALTFEINRAQTAEQGLQSQITQEISNRQSAVSSEQSRAEAAESALDARIDVLEAAPSPKGRKEVKTMSATDITNGYVDMAEEAMPKSMFVSVSGTVQYEDEDYTVSVVGGKSRVTFIGDLTPDGNGAALVQGEKVHFQYFVMSTSEQSSGGSSGGGGSQPQVNPFPDVSVWNVGMIYSGHFIIGGDWDKSGVTYSVEWGSSQNGVDFISTAVTYPETPLDTTYFAYVPQSGYPADQANINLFTSGSGQAFSPWYRITLHKDGFTSTMTTLGYL